MNVDVSLTTDYRAEGSDLAVAAARACALRLETRAKNSSFGRFGFTRGHNMPVRTSQRPQALLTEDSMEIPMKPYLAPASLCAALLFASAPVLAAPQAMHAVRESPAKTEAAATIPRQTARAHPERDWTGRSRMARGDREVRALNLLEAAGYRQFGDIVRKGPRFVTTANKHGELFSVSVAANGVISAKEM